MSPLQTFFRSNEKIDCIELPPLVDRQICAYLSGQIIGANSVLRVANGYLALLYNKKFRSHIYPSGYYQLHRYEWQLSQHKKQVDIIYFKINSKVTKNWHFFAKSKNEYPIKNLFYSGDYSLMVIDPKLFLSVILQRRTIADDQQIEILINAYIAKIINYYQGINFNSFALLTDVNKKIIKFGIIITQLRTTSSNNKKINSYFHPSSAKIKDFNKVFDFNAPLAWQQDNNYQNKYVANVAANENNKNNDKQNVKEASYYRVVDGRHIGPFTREQIETLIAQKKLRRHDLLWQSGKSSWQAAENFKYFNWLDE